MVGFAREKRVNRILVDGGSGINILPIRTMKELGISTTDLTDSRLMIQGFNQGGQRSIGTVKIDLTVGALQSSVWLHYYEDGVAKSIIADDNPFTEAEAHFADAKFYLKKYSIKFDAIASGYVGPLNNMAKVAVNKAKVANKEDSNLGNPNKMPNVIGAFSGKKVTPFLRYVPKAKEDKGHPLKLRENALEGLTLPVRRIDTVKSSTKLLGKSVAHKSLLHGKFVAPKSPLYEALPMKRTEEGFDPNAYRLLAKAGFDPNEPSKMGKLPSEPAMRQQREGLGYKQPPPIRISIKRVSNNYITVEDESTNSNKRPSVFDRLGSSTKRISVFESKLMEPSALPKSQNAPKDFQSLIPSRMRRQMNIVVSCGEVLKAKSHVVVYTKQRGEDEESVGSSYHVATQDERHFFSN
uniref:Gag-pol polyprotein n=1 Tax=Solanum tuberosum TaxID=4113 RepID=M1DD60_SOLTU